MSNDNWKYVKPLNDESSVKDFLAQNYIKLPDNLISIMERFNGGRPPQKDFFTETGREYVFKSLLSYNENDKETIYMVYPDIFKEKALYPVGSDAAGNYICFDLREEKFVLYNHETDLIESIVRMPFDV